MKMRRKFILGTFAAGSALAIGWGLLPPRQRLHTERPLPALRGHTALNGWVRIGTDDSVTILLAKSEMGQGVSTALAMLLADELDADWSRVVTENAPIDHIYNNLAMMVDGLPLHPDYQGTGRELATWLTSKTMREMGLMATGGSSSIKDLWLPMRQAGAAARALLVAAAARTWGVAADGISVQSGLIRHAASGKQARMGELAAAAAAVSLPAAPTLKTPAQFKLIGQSIARRDSAAKSDGSAVFGIDVRPTGLLHAAVRLCPTLGGSVANLSDAKARRMPGVKQVITLPPLCGCSGGVAVVADSHWQAERALKAVEVQWAAGPAASLSSENISQALHQAFDGDTGFGYHRSGDVEQALKGAAKTLHAEYHAPLLAHAALEPMNCTVQFKDGAATVWAPTQVPDLARRTAAKQLGIEPDRVTLNVTLLGGGFGRRLEMDVIAQAAFIARAMPDAPIQTLWSREQDMAHDFYRPPCMAHYDAALDAQGALVAWSAVSAGPSVVQQFLHRQWGLPGAGPDKTVAEGAYDNPYEWPNARVGHVIVDLPVPVGFWRSVGHSHQAFFKESFMDEVAHAAGADPVAFRAALLKQHPRHLKVLRRAAELARWGQALPATADGAAQAQGIALHHSFGAIVAQVAQVSLEPKTQGIRVHRVQAVIDCGLAVNPNLIAQQMESAIVFGLSAALHGQITLSQGQVQQSNFHDYPLLRMNECPAISIDIIASNEGPEGVGEPGTPPIAPAVANAVFKLTGKRLRSLPLRLG